MSNQHLLRRILQLIYINVLLKKILHIFVSSGDTQYSAYFNVYFNTGDLE